MIHPFSKYFLSDSDNTHMYAQVTQSSGVNLCLLEFPLDSLKITYLVAKDLWERLITQNKIKTLQLDFEGTLYLLFTAFK